MRDRMPTSSRFTYINQLTMPLLALIMWWILSWWLTQYWNQPLDLWLVGQVSTQQIEQPLFEWTASRYDYSLNINWEEVVWTKTHDVCALRIYERYGYYRVCTDDKCIVCKQTDFWPARQDRVIDLSSHAFKQLAPLKQGLVHVKVFKS